MKKELTEDILRDKWLKDYHNTTSEEVVKKYPELCKTPEWFKKYPVTKEQEQEWHDWMIDELAKYFHCSKRSAKEHSWLIYLNCSPYISNETDIQ